MDPWYAFLLDFFPLIEEVREYQTGIADALEALGLALLLRPDARSDAVEQLRILLRLCTDLGYIEMDVQTFLLKSLKKCEK
jgi:hypothetical protein